MKKHFAKALQIYHLLRKQNEFKQKNIYKYLLRPFDGHYYLSMACQPISRR